MSDLVDIQHDGGLLLGHAGVGGSDRTGHFAEVVKHLRYRDDQRWRISGIRISITITIIHTRTNLRVIFGFRHVNFLRHFLEFADLLGNRRMPVDRIFYRFFNIQRAGYSGLAINNLFIVPRDLLAIG